MNRLIGAILLAVLALTGCATLRDVVRAPEFALAPGREAELRLLPPSGSRPLGGVALRLWARVDNPNPFAVTLAHLSGDLQLEGMHAAGVDFPLGLPLPAAADTVVPLDITVDLSDVPGLGSVATRALTNEPIDYRLNGRVTVDAGVFGQPRFGPTTLLAGSVRPLR